MPLIPKKGLLTIAAMIDVGLNETARPVSAQILALRYGSSPRRLEPVLQALVHAGVLRGIRGPHGGYVLNREPHTITVAEILSAAVPASDDEDGETDDPLIRNVVAPALEAAMAAFSRALETVTLESLMARARQANIEPRQRPKTGRASDRG